MHEPALATARNLRAAACEACRLASGDEDRIQAMKDILARRRQHWRYGHELEDALRRVKRYQVRQ